MSSFFPLALSERFVRSASVPVLSFRKPHIGFVGSHRHLMHPICRNSIACERLSGHHHAETERDLLQRTHERSSRRRGCVCQMFRETTDHTRAQRAGSVASSAGRKALVSVSHVVLAARIDSANGTIVWFFHLVAHRVGRSTSFQSLQSASNSIASHTKSLPDPGKYPGPLRESRFSRRASGPESVGWRCRDAGSDSLERGHGLRAHPE
jgi:hypothetical protein